MLFSGTSITRGSGVAVVVATGLDTELGRITRLVEEAEPESSPLERKLARLSGQLLWFTLILTVLIAGLGLATGKDTYMMVEAAIALAVAAIPEGLPSWRLWCSPVACGAWHGKMPDRTLFSGRDTWRHNSHTHRQDGYLDGK